MMCSIKYKLSTIRKITHIEKTASVYLIVVLSQYLTSRMHMNILSISEIPLRSAYSFSARYGVSPRRFMCVRGRFSHIWLGFKGNGRDRKKTNHMDLWRRAFSFYRVRSQCAKPVPHNVRRVYERSEERQERRTRTKTSQGMRR